MKAAVICEYGGPEVLRYEDYPDPVSVATTQSLCQINNLRSNRQGFGCPCLKALQQLCVATTGSDIPDLENSRTSEKQRVAREARR